MKVFSPLIVLLSLAPTSLSQSVNDVAAQAMAQARIVLTGMVQGNSRLTPEFIRMGFHDCVGGCDGCIDLSNPDNNGLAHPISVLDPIVKKFASASTGLSRADIWALAAMVGADAADHGQTILPINFTQNWFGRVNCENSNSICLNSKGQSVPCSATAGPHRVLPSPSFTSAAVFAYFANNFGFNERQTVAIMGAHTCGHLVKNESGIDGPHGWTINNVALQNEYYNALMGAATASTPDNQKESLSPNWVRKFEDNSANGLPNRNRWQLDVAGLSLVMLNTDVGLVRDINASNSDATGAVSCTFNAQTGSPVCAIRSTTIDIAAQFSDSNDLWLSEFKAAMDLMLTTGYNRIACNSAVCPLATSKIAPPTSPVATTNHPTMPPMPVAPIAPVRPTPSAYMQPIVTHPPTPLPTLSSTAKTYGPGCCTQSFASCVNYCGTTQAQCKSCGDTTVVWLTNGVPPPNTCIPRWSDCTRNVNGCCPGLQCIGDQYWKGCQYV